jgi:hypothetical protein
LYSKEGKLLVVSTKIKYALSLDLAQHGNMQILRFRRSNMFKDAPRIHRNFMQLGLSFNEVSSIENLFAGQMDDNVKLLQDEGHWWFRSKLTELHLEQNRLDKTLHAQTLATMTNLELLDISAMKHSKRWLVTYPKSLIGWESFPYDP